jgi:Ca2+/Na+ antiporter
MIEPEKKYKRPASSFLKYSSLGFQLCAIFGLTLWGGLKIDKYLDWTEIPVITILLLFLVFVAFMYKLMKELNEK